LCGGIFCGFCSFFGGFLFKKVKHRGILIVNWLARTN
jgi:hypothetical protein